MNRLRLSLALLVLGTTAATAPAQYYYPGYPSYNNPAGPAYGAFLPYGMPVNYSPAPPNTMVTTGAFVATPPPAANGFSVGPPPIEAQVEPPYIPCVWGDIQYMLLWVKKAPIAVPLLTVGNPADVAPGALGQPGTTVVVGGDVEYGTMSAARVNVGMWLGYDRCIGIEGNVFRSENRVERRSVASATANDPALFVPFFDAGLGAELAAVVANPAAGITGSFATQSTFQFGGAEVNGVLNLGRSDCCETDFLLGVRYLRLKEALGISTVSADAALDTTTAAFDSFAARNEFYGGQMGGRVSFRSERCFLDTTAMLAVGPNYQTVNVAGLTSVTQTSTGAALGNVLGGNFTAASNIRQERHQELSVVPQFQLKAGINLSTNLSLFAAYDFLYWTQVVRPGDQLDHTQVPAPTPVFNRTDFWAQGVSFGMQIKF